jgi:transcriptional regulator with XRE-family HTH domain
VVDLRAAFGRRLRELRTARGWSQEELAHRAGLHWTYVGGIERGERNPALVNIGRLSRALGIGLAEMFGPFGDTSARRRR